MVRRCSSICRRASLPVSTFVLLIGHERGQQYAEDRARTRFAFNLYEASVRFNELSNERQPQAQPLALNGTRLLRAVELVENTTDHRFRHADAGIGDLDA